jgi:tRNA/rRNA methyltransferase
VSGTDGRISPFEGLNPTAPAVILVYPQLGENIGMAARAMLNCGLSDLRLVQPRDGWPSEKARRASAGADQVLEDAGLFETVSDAIHDLDLIYAASTRQRSMTKPVFTPPAAASAMRERNLPGTGIMFGNEAMGLNNDHLALADAMVSVPLNEEFSSLNLAQAVLITAYEWFKAADATPEIQMPMTHTRPANKEELMGLFEHLERDLDAGGFFHIREKRPIMVRNLRNLLQRAKLTEQEVRTLRGVISGLVNYRPPED